MHGASVPARPPKMSSDAPSLDTTEHNDGEDAYTNYSTLHTTPAIVATPPAAPLTAAVKLEAKSRVDEETPSQEDGMAIIRKASQASSPK